MRMTSGISPPLVLLEKIEINRLSKGYKIVVSSRKNIRDLEVNQADTPQKVMMIPI